MSKETDEVERVETVEGRRDAGVWLLIDRVKVILEILAILLAGVWAITLYWYYDAPSNVPRADLNGSLSWSKHSKDVCEAEYIAEFKNIGRVSVEVGRARLSAFPMPRLDELPADRVIKLIDPENAISGPPLIQEETKRLNKNYRPDERDEEGFTFIVKRSRGSLMLFKLDVWDKAHSEDVNAKPTWRDFRWDWVCGENPEAQEGGQ